MAGYGLNGRNLAHVLKQAGIAYVILDLNPETYRKAVEAEGEPIIFGDVSSPTILREAGIDKATGIVFAISDPATTRRGVRAARAIGNPSLFIIVRTRYAAEIDELYALGADDVIPEEFETSIEIFTRVLGKFHIPRNIIDAQIKRPPRRVLRHSARDLRSRPPVRGTDRRPPLGGDGRDVLCHPGLLAGRERPLKEIRSPQAPTGATVIAVVRGDESFTSPGAEFRDRIRGHAGPRRQPSGHGPGLPLPYEEGRGPRPGLIVNRGQTYTSAVLADV